MKKSISLLPLLLCALLAALPSRAQAQTEAQDELRFAVYMTASSVLHFFEQTDPDPMTTLAKMGITKVYLEVYRGRTYVPPEHLIRVRDYFQERGVTVSGGIATVPGGDYGLPQEGPLGWFNWQNAKTQADMKAIMRAVAPVFDEFVVDDFFCTGDISAESNAARGDRSWGDYRLDLMVDVGRDVFINPAHEANPDLTLIIKYPQWYDRFHLFGYDVPRQSAQFDLTWVGTETRGAHTQRYGFTPPYEGFVNYRWIQSIAGAKTQGAWFDHGDCDGPDFLEQAYQTVLAGAPEIVFFNYGNVRESHPGHRLVADHLDKLRQLSAFVRANPVHGVPAYKPPNSDPGGDMYLMDFLGMMGIPIVPVSQFPSQAHVILIPTQAAADPAIVSKVRRALENGSRVIFTAAFLSRVPALRNVAGIGPIETIPGLIATTIQKDETTTPLPRPLDLHGQFELTSALSIMSARNDEGEIPYLVRSHYENVFVLNSHTYSQADFDAVGEVLLAPNPLGILDFPRSAANTLRRAFIEPLRLHLDAPTRVSLQPMGEKDWVIHNYRNEPAYLQFDAATAKTLRDVLDESIIENGSISLAPRSRIWLRAP